MWPEVKGKTVAGLVNAGGQVGIIIEYKSDDGHSFIVRWGGEVDAEDAAGDVLQHGKGHWHPRNDGSCLCRRSFQLLGGSVQLAGATHAATSVFATRKTSNDLRTWWAFRRAPPTPAPSPFSSPF